VASLAAQPIERIGWQVGQANKGVGEIVGLVSKRHRATRTPEELLDGEAEATRKAIELALGGDMTALRLCLDRILPARKSGKSEHSFNIAPARDNGLSLGLRVLRGYFYPTSRAAVVSSPGTLGRGSILYIDNGANASCTKSQTFAYSILLKRRRFTDRMGAALLPTRDHS
jgi:hypothetical protein